MVFNGLFVGIFYIKIKLICLNSFKYILTNLTARAESDIGSIFKQGLTNLDSELPKQGWRTQSALLFTHSWKKNKRIHVSQG